MPLIPASEQLRQADLRESEASLVCSEFQDRQGYIKTLSLLLPTKLMNYLMLSQMNSVKPHNLKQRLSVFSPCLFCYMLFYFLCIAIILTNTVY